VGVCQRICDCVCMFYKSWIWGSHFEEECFVVGQMLCFWRFCLCVSLSLDPTLAPKKQHQIPCLESTGSDSVREREIERERIGEMWSDALAWFARDWFVHTIFVKQILDSVTVSWWIWSCKYIKKLLWVPSRTQNSWKFESWRSYLRLALMILFSHHLRNLEASFRRQNLH
jgi:hypothetical protein